MAPDLLMIEVADELMSKGLKNPDLRVLDPNPALVKFLLFQPQAVVVANATQVGVRNCSLLTLQMKGFLQKAFDADVDLALCPEYSCTWAALTEAVEDNLFPKKGKLWVIPCESATKTQFNAALTRFKQKQLEVVFDPSVWESNGDFADTVCYLFKTQRQDGTPVDTVLMQFKTQPMGGSHFEDHYLKTGRKIYRFKNSSNNSGKLVVFICSDALHPQFSTNIAPELSYDTYVLHPQMNTNSTSPGYCAYRVTCCGNTPRTTEVLALNWAAGTKLDENGQDKDFITESKSIWFRELCSLKLDDNKIMANHNLGFYLTHWNRYTAAYLLSPEPRLFLIDTEKPFVQGPATNAVRSAGPTMLELFNWNSKSSSWNPTMADDQFKTTWCDPYLENQPILNKLLPSRYLDAERLIQLSIGEANDIQWVSWISQPSFKLATDDTPHRLTLCWSKTGDGPAYRRQCLANFRGFSEIVNKPSQFSTRLTEFQNGVFSVEHKTERLCLHMRNLYINDDTQATGIYAGFAPTEEHLKNVKAKTRKALHETGSDLEKLAIWYREPDGTLKDYMDKAIPKVNDDPKEGPVAIDNGET